MLLEKKNSWFFPHSRYTFSVYSLQPSYGRTTWNPHRLFLSQCVGFFFVHPQKSRVLRDFFYFFVIALFSLWPQKPKFPSSPCSHFLASSMPFTSHTRRIRLSLSAHRAFLVPHFAISIRPFHAPIFFRILARSSLESPFQWSQRSCIRCCLFSRSLPSRPNPERS